MSHGPDEPLPEGVAPSVAAALRALQAQRAAMSDTARSAAIAKQHALGKMSARERLANLLDPLTFEEFGALVAPKRDSFDAESLQAPADGVVTGYGRIDGRPVCICAFDFTILGGSNGRVGEHKLERLVGHATQHGCPVILLLDGGGHRIQEGLDSRHYAIGSPFFEAAVRLSGWVPTVAVMMGPGFAGPSNFAALCDYVVMVRGTATMGIAGPALVEAATGEVIDKDTLGGADVQVDRNGLADIAADDDLSALALVRRYLSYLPSNASLPPPCVECSDPVDRADDLLLTLLPDNPRQGYDVRRIVEAIADRDSVLEVKPGFARNLVTAFARIGGRPVGIVANQPLHLAGTLDSPGCEKGAHFVSLCDAFGLALVYLVDMPGFLVGTAAEDQALARRSARMVYELGQATVPRMSVVIRKGYGLGYIAMCGGRSFDADLCVAWPTAEICAMSIEGAVDVAYRKRVQSAADPQAERAHLIARFKAQLGPAHAAEDFGIDDVIDPRDTRAVLAAALSRCPTRKRHTAFPARQHGISPI